MNMKALTLALLIVAAVILAGCPGGQPEQNTTPTNNSSVGPIKVCTENDVKSCSVGVCPGTSTCADNAWGACQKADASCGVVTTCSVDEECATACASGQRENCVDGTCVKTSSGCQTTAPTVVNISVTGCTGNTITVTNYGAAIVMNQNTEIQTSAGYSLTTIATVTGTNNIAYGEVKTVGLTSDVRQNTTTNPLTIKIQKPEGGTKSFTFTCMLPALTAE